MQFTPQHIANIIHAQSVLGIFYEEEISLLATDTRQIINGQATCFFALTGGRDGHDFVPEAFEAGVRCFVVQKMRTEWEPMQGYATFILVASSLQALQQLATFKRNQYTIPVIGITGSNGKTTVKEWLFQLLHQDYRILFSPRSYNSQIGVPLSVWPIQEAHQLAIFEAGISKVDEMDRLANIIQPTIGVLTNIGHAHDEGFPDLNVKFNEKQKLFRQVERLVLPYAVYQQYHLATSPDWATRCFTWGTAMDADLRYEVIETTATYTQLVIWYKQQSIACRINLAGEVHLHNALTCIATACLLGMPLHTLIVRLAYLKPLYMRLEWRRAWNNLILLNDSYSNDLTGLYLTMATLRTQASNHLKYIILSDLLEQTFDVYAKAVDMLRTIQYRQLVLVGKQWEAYFQAHPKDVLPNVIHFPETANLLHALPGFNWRNAAILLKGARSFGFEQVANYFDIQLHQTRVEVHLPNLLHNLRQYQAGLQPGVKTMAMVKAFGYGTGSHEVATLLQQAGVHYLAVAYADEGVALRKAGIRLPIMVMNTELQSMEAVIAHQLEPVIFSFSLATALIQQLAEQGLPNWPVHIELETGMQRLGIDEATLPALIQLLQQQPLLQVKSIFTHLAASEDAAEDGFTTTQVERFQRMASTLQQQLPQAAHALWHVLNSAGIARHPQWQLNMVRLGVGLYGVDPANAKALRLLTVLSWKTTIAQIKELPPFTSIGYNRRAVFPDARRIATLRVGYADGYSRLLGNGKGQVVIRGQLAPVVGTVCMDMLMIDITHIPHVQEGDEVELIGETMPVTTVAAAAQTIPYEIFTGIAPRVKRVYIWE